MKIGKKEKYFVFIVLVISMLICITSATYAYLLSTNTDTNTISGNLATINLSLAVERILPLTNSDNSGVIVPQLSNYNSSSDPLESALQAECIDGNKNIICQVYKITVKNDKGTANLVIDGLVSFYSDTEMTKDAHEDIPNLKWKLIDTVDIDNPTNSVIGNNIDNEANSLKNKFIANSKLIANTEYKYYMIIWLNETGDKQDIDAGKNFYGKISIEGANGLGVTATFNS